MKKDHPANIIPISPEAAILNTLDDDSTDAQQPSPEEILQAIPDWQRIEAAASCRCRYEFLDDPLRKKAIAVLTARIAIIKSKWQGTMPAKQYHEQLNESTATLNWLNHDLS